MYETFRLSEDTTSVPSTTSIVESMIKKGVFKRKGGWVFISHSHMDIDKVRSIRNALERKGFDPLLFYLKCLEKEHEIHDLIEREIKERDWLAILKMLVST